jgi:hypothetical protein
LVIALAMLSGFAFASDNQSANYVRMLSRETATDAIDIAYNNPAGTAFLEPGFHVQANSQTIYLNYSHTSVVTSTEYASKKWIPIVPTGYFGYNGGDWAGFFSFTILKAAARWISKMDRCLLRLSVQVLEDRLLVVHRSLPSPWWSLQSHGQSFCFPSWNYALWRGDI